MLDDNSLFMMKFTKEITPNFLKILLEKENEFTLKNVRVFFCCVDRDRWRREMERKWDRGRDWGREKGRGRREGAEQRGRSRKSTGVKHWSSIRLTTVLDKGKTQYLRFWTFLILT